MRLRLRDDAPGLLRIERSEPGRWSRRLRTMALVNVFVAFLFVPSAVANPFCYIPLVCEAREIIDFATDPLGYVSAKVAEANVWFLSKMLELIENTSKVDLTSSGFVKQYAIIFAASSLLTVALWLVAVAKRAIRGVALTTAIGEAIGFLLLQVVVNAMTPGAIALLMKAIDEVTEVFAPTATANLKPFLENMLKVMVASPGASVVALLVVNLIMLLGALLMWVELLIRSAAIYVAVALGPIINAGLVDRDLWGKSKKWFGAVFALGLTKPVLFALLGLGGAVLSSDSTGKLSDDVSQTLVGGLILLLAVFASATLYKWLPAFGDEMAQLHHDRKTAMSSGPAAMVDGPAQHANRAMSTHIQDALVGGGGKATAGKAAGTAAARTGGGTAMAGPIGATATALKAGVDLGKGKAMSSPGAKGPDVTGDGTGEERQEPQQGGDGQAPDAPASTRPRGGPWDPVLSADQKPRPSSPPEPPEPRPVPAGGGSPGGGPVVGAPEPSEPPRRSAPPAPGSGLSTPSTPPRPTGDHLPGRPDPSKDQ